MVTKAANLYASVMLTVSFGSMFQSLITKVWLNYCMKYVTKKQATTHRSAQSEEKSSTSGKAATKQEACYG